METVKLDYMKLRSIYEQSGNATALDQLVKHYLANEMENSNYNVEIHPFLKGITIDKNDISPLSNTKLLCCIISGAEPRTKLIEEALRGYRTLGPTIFLYKRKMITFGQLLPRFMEGRKTDLLNTIEGIKQLFDLENRDEYKDLNLKELESALVSCIDRLHYYSDYCKYGLSIAMRFLTTLPYNDVHLKVIRQIRSNMTMLKTGNESIKDIESILIDHLRPIFIDLQRNDLIELIHSRPDYTVLFTDSLISFLTHSLLCESKQAYDALMDSIYNDICAGKIDRISFALELFPRLQGRAIEIVNYWAQHDMTLEIDVYGMPLLQEEDYDSSLDDKYIAAKQKAKETSKESFTMKPIDPKKPQE